MSIGEVANCRSRIYELCPGKYWHLTRREDYLLGNAVLAEGLVHSISKIDKMPGLENAISHYGLKARSEPKEATWERIRIARYPNLPTRQGAIFLFENQEEAEEAMKTWFPNEHRVLVEVRLITGSNVLRADARLLDCMDTHWEVNAEKYWRGEMTDNPLVEIIVDGLVYLPSWRDRHVEDV